MNKAVFLDRDGVINQRPMEGEYIKRWEDIRILPGTAEAIATLNRAGFRVIVVTNQRCVAIGLLTASELELIHDRMRGELAVSGAVIDDIYYCPHDKQPPCSCRKPLPGMLITASLAHQINLTQSWMIGDSDIDIEAGRNAGCKTVQVAAVNTLVDEQWRRSATAQCADILAASLLDAIRQIVRWDAAAGSSKK